MKFVKLIKNFSKLQDKCQTVQNLRQSNENCLKDEDNKNKNKTLLVQDDVKNSKAKNSDSIAQNNSLQKDDFLENEDRNLPFFSDK